MLLRLPHGACHDATGAATAGGTALGGGVSEALRRHSSVRGSLLDQGTAVSRDSCGLPMSGIVTSVVLLEGGGHAAVILAVCRLCCLPEV